MRFFGRTKKSTHVHTHTQTQWTSSVLTPPYVGLGVVADAKRNQSVPAKYSMSPTSYSSPPTALIINHTRADYFLINYRPAKTKFKYIFLLV